MSSRPILCGMNNPLSQRPEYALWPDPPGCTGHRLWALLNSRVELDHENYAEAFERMNLVVGDWDRTRAFEAGKVLRARLAGSGRTVVALGVNVAEALGLRKELVLPQVIDGATYRSLPHPSGRNPWYNNPWNRTVASMLLEELYEEAH